MAASVFGELVSQQEQVYSFEARLFGYAAGVESCRPISLKSLPRFRSYHCRNFHDLCQNCQQRFLRSMAKTYAVPVPALHFSDTDEVNRHGQALAGKCREDGITLCPGSHQSGYLLLHEMAHWINYQRLGVATEKYYGHHQYFLGIFLNMAAQYMQWDEKKLIADARQSGLHVVPYDEFTQRLRDLRKTSRQVFSPAATL